MSFASRITPVCRRPPLRIARSREGRPAEEMTDADLHRLFERIVGELVAEIRAAGVPTERQADP